MTTLTATKTPFNRQSGRVPARRFSAPFDSVRSGLDSDTRALLSVLGRTLYLLGLGTIGVVAVTGQPPLFFLPLALFLFFGSCLQWRQSNQSRVRGDLRLSVGLPTSSMRSGPLADYNDIA